MLNRYWFFISIIFSLFFFTNTADAHHSGGGSYSGSHGGYRYTYRYVPAYYSYYNYGAVQRPKSFEAATIPEINKAKKTIVLVVKRIASRRVSRALEVAQKRGVKIQIISEVKNTRTKLPDAVTRYEDNINQFGGEFAIIDGAEFVSGSLGNYEYTLTSPDFIKKYQDEFDHSWESAALVTVKTRPSPWPKLTPKMLTCEVKTTTPPVTDSGSVVDRLEKMLKSPANRDILAPAKVEAQTITKPYKPDPVTEDTNKIPNATIERIKGYKFVKNIKKIYVDAQIGRDGDTIAPGLNTEIIDSIKKILSDSGFDAIFLCHDGQCDSAPAYGKSGNDVRYLIRIIVRSWHEQGDAAESPTQSFIRLELLDRVIVDYPVDVDFEKKGINPAQWRGTTLGAIKSIFGEVLQEFK